jgi:hypothetical protein
MKVVRESARAEETQSHLSYRKALLETGRRDGCGSLGQVVGAQGVLIRPE